MESLSDSLKKRIARKEVGSALSASFIVEMANRIIPAPYRAKVYREGVLTVESPTGARAYFFKESCEQYLESINAALPESIIKQIRVRIKH